MVRFISTVSSQAEFRRCRKWSMCTVDVHSWCIAISMAPSVRKAAEESQKVCVSYMASS